MTLLLDVMGHKDTVGSFRNTCPFSTLLGPFDSSEALTYAKCALLNVLTEETFH